MNQECVFCKIIRGDLPADKVYEDDRVVGFLDLRPSSKGHTLIVPKAHTPDFQSASEEILRSLFAPLKKIAAAIMRATGAQGYNLSVNNGAAAGQIIFHLHFHLVPRYLGDHLKLFPQSQSEPSSRKALAEQIRKNFS